MSQTVQKQDPESTQEQSEKPPSWKKIGLKAWDNKLSLLYEAAKFESGNYKSFYRLNSILMGIIALVTSVPIYLPLLWAFVSELHIRNNKTDSLINMYFDSIYNRIQLVVFTVLVFFFLTEYTMVSILVASLSIIYWKIKNDTML